MDEAFWDERWRENRIGFHEPAANALLTDHWDRLALAPGAPVFVPLCGKSLDLDWLLARGFTVTGVEFNRMAVAEVFDRLDLAPVITRQGPLECFTAGALRLFVGDAFALTAAMLGPVAANYDRAALVALPPETRPRYARRLIQVTGAAPQLLVTMTYDQSQTNGPPFSVPAGEVTRYYAKTYDLDVLTARPLGGPVALRAGGGEEEVRLLRPRAS
ncbi:MAG: thiopurine S-methyltransferase [Pseudomonadota bacterium]